MPDLNFQVIEAVAVPYAETPLLNFRLRLESRPPDVPIHSIQLRCQLMIEAPRRRYNVAEAERLYDLFGAPEQWERSLRSTLWTHAQVSVPQFAGSTVVDLPVPCTFDFNVAATKYFAALEAGEVPLLLLFSGTLFYAGPSGALQVTQIPWEKEAQYRLPVRVWQTMMQAYYPNTVWLTLRRDVFDQLARYKRRRGLPTFEQALESLLPVLEETPFEELPDESLNGPNNGEMIH
jgi:hypothetical protein